MILVVADMSPLRYLVEIGYESLLPRLFAKVWIPGTVLTELRHKRTPAAVGRWAEQLPSWIEVRHVGGAPAAHELAGLDRGEWEAIELAKEIQPNLLARWAFWSKPLDPVSFLSTRRWPSSRKRTFAGPRICSRRRGNWCASRRTGPEACPSM
jgi:hypothetical protein